jgi:hypothetical protein
MCPSPPPRLVLPGTSKFEASPPGHQVDPGVSGRGGRGGEARVVVASFSSLSGKLGELLRCRNRADYELDL